MSINNFEVFCGGPVWDANLTWNTNHPDFTPCFQNSILVYVQCGFLWLVFPLYNIYLSRRTTLHAPRSRLQYSRLVGVLVLLGVTVCNIIRGIKDLIVLSNTAPSVLVSPIIQLFTYILTLYLINKEHNKKIITSGVFFFFFFITIISGVIPIHSFIFRATQNGYFEDILAFVLYLLFYLTSLVELILYCFSDIRVNKNQLKDVDETTREQCPEVTASFLSKLLYWWMNGLMIAGYKNILKEEDVWLANPRDLTRKVAPPLERAWEKEVNKAKRKSEKESCLQQNGLKSLEHESTPLKSLGEDKTIPEVQVIDKNKKTKHKPSLLIALIRAYGLKFLEAHLYKLIEDILLLSGPIIQSLLINYVMDETVESWKGYLYAFLFFVVSIVNTILFEKMFQLGNTMGIHMRSGLISALYKKALRISNETRSKTTVGEIVNLMAVDADRVLDISVDLYVLWSGPVMLCLITYLLYNIFGAPVFSGIIIVIIMLPVNGIGAWKLLRLENKVMELKDERIKLTNEMLSGIKVVKLNAWERSFEQKIEAIREKEIKYIRSTLFLHALGNFTWTTAPFLMLFATFATYIMTGGILDASKAFTAMSLFNILRYPLGELPFVVSYCIMTSVSIRRIRDFLLSENIEDDLAQHNQNNDTPVIIENGTFIWNAGGETTSPTLKNVNLKIPNGKLYAVIGPVGCGKSSLLSAMLREMVKLEGKTKIAGCMAYVAQQPWIQNLTLRDNILFGSAYDEEKYNKVLEACALLPDLEILPKGDMTEIGEKGINLSGGQKQRVSLARAVYSDKDIYLLDDALSAVDAHVGREIFNKVISRSKSLLANKTVVLVTHGLQWLPHTDGIVVMNDGEITETGTYDELIERDGNFSQFIATHLNTEGLDDQAIAEEVRSQILSRLNSLADAGDSEFKVGSPSSPTVLSHRIRSRASEASEDGRHPLSSRLPSRQTSHTGWGDKHVDRVESMEKFTEEEDAQVGSVKLSVYGLYFRAMGLLLAAVAFMSYACCEASSMTASIWLSRWTSDEILTNESFMNTSFYNDQTHFYLGVYGAVCAIQVSFTLIYSLLMVFGFIKASKVLHGRMLGGILRSPLSFFETTPIGRILNRFSHDIEAVDNLLPMFVKLWFITLLLLLSILIIISYSAPLFLVLVPPIGVVYYFIQRLYIPTSRQVKRISSITRSPIYAHFSETLAGVSTIRAYGAEQRFIRDSEAKVDHNIVYYYANISSNRWIGLWLQILGSFIVLATALFSVIGRGQISGGLVGLAITYALQLTDNLEFFVLITSSMEKSMVSVERIEEYTNNAPENAWLVEGSLPHPQWPLRGEITFDHYSTKYKTASDNVLKNLCFTIQPGEKVGIVGRTGAGKSSITLALLRILERTEGSILVDGGDIACMGLHQLRSRITILPQDPVLFAGTLRMNVDPVGLYNDSEIWKALEHSHLKSFVQDLPSGLNYECGEGGLNLSVGQRQLVCLARALLKRTRVLILDEATAAVDVETDDLIQKTIRESFNECTVIAIAHRLNTIIDYDRILVMDKGEVAEFDTPNNLLNNKSSRFYSMAKDANLVQ